VVFTGPCQLRPPSTKEIAETMDPFFKPMQPT